MRAAAGLGALLLALAAGCSREAPERAGSPPSPADSVAESPEPPRPAAWYERTRTLDLTGDARPDRVRLAAVGARAESLRVTLTIHVDGEEVLREAWSSQDELAHLDAELRSPEQDASSVRTRLDRVLAGVALHRLGAPGLRLMAEDSTALAGLAPRPVHGVTFSYGFETTVRLAWDAARGRFVRLFTCC